MTIVSGNPVVMTLILLLIVFVIHSHIRGVIGTWDTRPESKYQNFCHDYGNVEENVGYWDANIKTVSARSAEDCSCQCSSLPNCVAWSWEYGSGFMYCGLKATKYDRRVSTTYISGTLVGGGGGGSGPFCHDRANVQHKYGYWDANIKVVYTATAEECSCECSRLSNCVAWSWKYCTSCGHRHYCGLKATSHQGRYSNEYVSGYIRRTIPCSTCPSSNYCSPTRCNEKNVGYWASNIKTVYTSTPEECSCECAKLSGCVSWSWAYNIPANYAYNLQLYGKMYCGLKGSNRLRRACNIYESGTMYC